MSSCPGPIAASLPGTSNSRFGRSKNGRPGKPVKLPSHAAFRRTAATVAIARALVNNASSSRMNRPAISIPSPAVDSGSVPKAQPGRSDIALVTHDPEIVADSRRIEIRDGKIAKQVDSKPVAQITLWTFLVPSVSGKEIWAHKFRSVLTMLGIILGVSSLVAMSALAKGWRMG